ncbi:MAG: PIN domain-containing protein [Actinomycetia bacterium]|nr:PIN domain-containing protein [Actinomycetes bacterium]
MTAGMPQQVVLDTNVFVSGMLAAKESPPVQLIRFVQTGFLKIFYDWRILAEYHEVMARPAFGFNPMTLDNLFEMIESYGFDVDPFHVDIEFLDETDRPFYEVAKLCFCPLVTGNLKHFPAEDWIMSPAQYLEGL